MRVIAALLAGGCLFVTLSAQPAFSPARYQGGSIPILPAVSVGVGGGQVLLEVTISSSGEVAGITTLRSTASFTELTVNAVRNWRFVPAREGRQSVRSKVLVAALYRPPTLHSPTLGEPVQGGAPGSAETPFPMSAVMPPFPPRARDPGIVLVEVEVGASGAVMNVRVVRSAPPFDGAARDAARRWTFRPARAAGRLVPSVAYILFAFPTPRT